MSDADKIQTKELLEPLKKMAAAAMKSACVALVRGEARKLSAGGLRSALENVAAEMENISTP